MQKEEPGWGLCERRAGRTKHAELVRLDFFGLEAFGAKGL